MEEVAWLRVARGCQQNPSCLRFAEDEIQIQLVRFFSCSGVVMCLEKLHHSKLIWIFVWLGGGSW